jgi:anti-sigma regulatory factor (Ser/Thr protein kinase)
VVALSKLLVAQAPGDQRWLRVEEPSAAAGCRAAATALASRLDFPAARSDQLVLAVTEAASNLFKHARQGSMLLRITRVGDAPGVEMVTIDAGPGFRDTGAAMRDGHSTSGTLGIGLGAIRRLADFCELYSVPGHGTVLVARFWAEPRSETDSCAGLVRPISGETECGDVFAAVETDGTLTGVLCDGLGHGPLAAIAANEAVHAVLDGPAGGPAGGLAGGQAGGPAGGLAGGPAAAVARAHSRMSHTRGGALAVVQVTGRLVRFCGLGNIAAVILADGARKSMLSVPGIAGHQARAIRQFDYDAPPGAAIILHSDGLSSRWGAESLPGLNARDPLVAAAALLAEAGTRRDDASVLVLKP